MGTRELVILLLGLAIVAVVLRGLYVAIQSRRGQIRLAIDSNIPQVDLDALELSELPNGGARIVSRSRESAAIAREAQETAAAETNQANLRNPLPDVGQSQYQNKLDQFDDQSIPVLMDAVEVRDADEEDIEEEFLAYDEQDNVEEAANLDLAESAWDDNDTIDEVSQDDFYGDDESEAISDNHAHVAGDDFDYAAEPQLGNGLLEADHIHATAEQNGADLVDYEVGAGGDFVEELVAGDNANDTTAAVADYAGRHEEELPFPQSEEDGGSQESHPQYESATQSSPEPEESLSFEDQLGDFSFSAGDRIGELRVPETSSALLQPPTTEASSQAQEMPDSEAVQPRAEAPLDQSELFSDNSADQEELEQMAHEPTAKHYDRLESDAVAAEPAPVQREDVIEAVNDFAESYDPMDVLTEGFAEQGGEPQLPPIEDSLIEPSTSESASAAEGDGGSTEGNNSFGHFKNLVPSKQASKAAGKAAGNLFRNFSSALSNVAGPARGHSDADEDFLLHSNLDTTDYDDIDRIPNNVTSIAAASSVEPGSFNAEAEASQASLPAEPSEVILLNVTAPRGYAFLGDELFRILSSQGVDFGDMDIFHRRDHTLNSRPVVFSVANMVNPGTFDISNLAEFTTPGISFFMTLPGAVNNLEAFDAMLNSAQNIANGLGGELRDDQRNGITAQTIEHYRQRIRDFELQRLRVAGARR